MLSLACSLFYIRKVTSIEKSKRDRTWYDLLSIDKKPALIDAYPRQDWRVESVIYEGAKESIALQASFVPRVGELVLFYRGKRECVLNL